MTDVLDRLRAANPVADLDTVRNDVHPLVLPSHPRAGRGLRPARRVAVLAAITAALVLAAGLPGDRSSGPGSLGRIDLAPAVAATLEPGESILHIVTRTSQSGPRGAEHTWSTDFWLTPDDGGRVRVNSQNGNDASFRVTGKDAREPVTALRDMLEDGTLRSTGRTTLEGLAVETFATADDQLVLYANADTMQPVRSVLERGTGEDQLIAVTDFVKLERVADTPENRRKVG